MTKEEINKTIFSLQNDEEIFAFVSNRISELENNAVETTVGQNYTTSFKEYISDKTHYKAGAKLKDAECPDLVYDDITPYINLIKRIKHNKWYNELLLFSIIFFEIYKYLPSDDNGLGRAMTYFGNKEKRISIKQIHENACAFCSEKSGMAHNMFKFLGIDSEVVCGYRNTERHAYNIVYPNGYGNEPMVIYDPSFFVNFIKDEDKLSFGYYKALSRDDYEKLMEGIPIKIDLSKTEKNYRQLYQLSDDYAFEGDTPSYIAGLNAKQEITENDIISDLYYSAHLENGVESVTKK